MRTHAISYHSHPLSFEQPSKLLQHTFRRCQNITAYFCLPTKGTGFTNCLIIICDNGNGVIGYCVLVSNIQFALLLQSFCLFRIPTTTLLPPAKIYMCSVQGSRVANSFDVCNNPFLIFGDFFCIELDSETRRFRFS